MKKASYPGNHLVLTTTKPVKAKFRIKAEPSQAIPSPMNGDGLLTTKELHLLELLSYGYENGDIAEHFQTSLQAVKNMLRTINLKLGADNRTHAVAISFRNGWLPLKARP